MVHEAGQGPPVVLCHGFPELAYSWRHQLGSLADAGFRAIAPDQRGYGLSSVPESIDAYNLVCLTDDLVRLLDTLGIEKAFFSGHDWGGFVAWAMPLRYPERCLGVIGVNTPYMAFPTPAQLRKLVDDEDKVYILWFQKPGVAEAYLDQHTRDVFTELMVRGVDRKTSSNKGLVGAESGGMNPFKSLGKYPPRGERLLSDSELDYYTRHFEHSGFFGPVSWYRNAGANAELVPGLGKEKLDLPSLMICAAWDPVLTPAQAEHMPALLSNLEMHTIDRCGHWTQQEKPDELSALMIDWLRRQV